MGGVGIEDVKLFMGAGGTIAVLVWLVHYFQGKLDTKDTVIAKMVEDQGKRDVVMAGALERIASALDRIERRLEGHHGELSNPGIRSVT